MNSLNNCTVGPIYLDSKDYIFGCAEKKLFVPELGRKMRMLRRNRVSSPFLLPELLARCYWRPGSKGITVVNTD